MIKTPQEAPNRTIQLIKEEMRRKRFPSVKLHQVCSQMHSLQTCLVNAGAVLLVTGENVTCALLKWIAIISEQFTPTGRNAIKLARVQRVRTLAEPDLRKRQVSTLSVIVFPSESLLFSLLALVIAGLASGDKWTVLIRAALLDSSASWFAFSALIGLIISQQASLKLGHLSAQFTLVTVVCWLQLELASHRQFNNKTITKASKQH